MLTAGQNKGATLVGQQFIREPLKALATSVNDAGLGFHHQTASIVAGSIRTHEAVMKWSVSK